jgi:hypothetical protein
MRDPETRRISMHSPARIALHTDQPCSAESRIVGGGTVAGAGSSLDDRDKLDTRP